MKISSKVYESNYTYHPFHLKARYSWLSKKKIISKWRWLFHQPEASMRRMIKPFEVNSSRGRINHIAFPAKSWWNNHLQNFLFYKSAGAAHGRQLPNLWCKKHFCMVLCSFWKKLNQTVTRAWEYWIMYPHTGLVPGQIERNL